VRAPPRRGWARVVRVKRADCAQIGKVVVGHIEWRLAIVGQGRPRAPRARADCALRERGTASRRAFARAEQTAHLVDVVVVGQRGANGRVNVGLAQHRDRRLLRLARTARLGCRNRGPASIVGLRANAIDYVGAVGERCGALDAGDERARLGVARERAAVEPRQQRDELPGRVHAQRVVDRVGHNGEIKDDRRCIWARERVDGETRETMRVDGETKETIKNRGGDKRDKESRSEGHKKWHTRDANVITDQLSCHILPKTTLLIY